MKRTIDPPKSLFPVGYVYRYKVFLQLWPLILLFQEPDVINDSYIDMTQENTDIHLYALIIYPIYEYPR